MCYSLPMDRMTRMARMDRTDRIAQRVIIDTDGGVDAPRFRNLLRERLCLA